MAAPWLWGRESKPYKQVCMNALVRLGIQTDQVIRVYVWPQPTQD